MYFSFIWKLHFTELLLVSYFGSKRVRVKKKNKDPALNNSLYPRQWLKVHSLSFFSSVHFLVLPLYAFIHFYSIKFLFFTITLISLT